MDELEKPQPRIASSKELEYLYKQFNKHQPAVYIHLALTRSGEIASAVTCDEMFADLLKTADEEFYQTMKHILVDSIAHALDENRPKPS